MDSVRVIALKRSDVCCICGKDLPSGLPALWDVYGRTITCLDCAAPGEALEAFERATA